MKYHIQITNLENGLSIYIPNPILVKPTYEQLLLQDVKTPFPFWAKLWASSKVLTKFLITQPDWVTSKTILEIGAGIGQPSFTIANKAKEVIISDHNKDAVALIQTNISHLGLTNSKGLILDWNVFEWNTLDFPFQADVILLSDINYAPGEFGPLLKMIAHYISNGAVIIIATPQRIMGATFIESLQEFIKHSHTESILEQDVQVPINIYILYK
jgi:predicted nicotinamide N-methyase